ncbi:nitrogen fixation protein FixH [Paucibacter sp. R3-3]|uniref:Nitrogen fixation protein FixH n=1 Tax=Roseateles agri TaxID=3098619 RepID=A0ABU5DQ09_9BURK|nr:nitrogen fixation protein FixH [Paucibacter sp. R3-3]MDY0747359.1 nitrogen fixation protein FixH [Paucibacter sp. R3-3]
MNPTETPQPWWRVRMMWLVVMGPALVVVASFVTLALAVHGADPPLPPDTASHAHALTPAQLARNHAATPADDH